MSVISCTTRYLLNLLCCLHNFSVAGRAEQAGFFLQNDVHWNFDERAGKAPFVQESRDERAIFELFQNLGWNATAQIHPTEGQRLERHVSTFRAEDANESG